MSGAAEASGDRSIAAAGSIRQAVTGDGAVAHYTERSLTLPPEAFELPQAPPNMVNLPDRAGLFVGRRPELRSLDTAFERTGGVVVQAVHGLGGIGKSTLAAKWAAGKTASYNPVWWITAVTPLEIESGLAGLAVALQPALRDVLSQEALAERAVQWLGTHTGWLLVLDNVSDPVDVRPLLGRIAGGRFLITTRRATGWHGIAETLPVDVLGPAEAVELFERIYGDPAQDVQELCGELGCLPLAVEQAAAYCAEARIIPRAYLELLARSPERVLANTAEGVDGLRTVARVWRVTMDRLADTPLAETILRVIAWWAPDGIPRAYVAPLADESDITEALRRLAAHSMIRLHEDETISVHRLVQAISRTGEDAAETYEEAVGLLLGREQAMLGSVWITHAEVLAEHGHGKMASEGVLLLTIAVGNWYATNLSPGRASELHEAAMTGAERVLGPRSPITLLARQCVAHRCRETEPGRAVRLLTENVAVAKRVFGRNARRTFNARTSLARLKLNLGDISGGLSLAARNARRAERALGGDDPVILAADAVVAQGWRMRAESDPDRYAVRAAAEIERLLIKAIRVDGAFSETVLDLMWELGGVRETTGDLAGAIRMTQEYLEKYSVPPDSMDLSGLTARVRIVQLLVDAGHPQQARELAIALLAETEQELAGSEVGSRFRDALAALVVRIAPADDT